MYCKQASKQASKTIYYLLAPLLLHPSCSRTWIFPHTYTPTHTTHHQVTPNPLHSDPLFIKIIFITSIHSIISSIASQLYQNVVPILFVSTPLHLSTQLLLFLNLGLNLLGIRHNYIAITPIFSCLHGHRSLLSSLGHLSLSLQLSFFLFPNLFALGFDLVKVTLGNWTCYHADFIHLCNVDGLGGVFTFIIEPVLFSRQYKKSQG
ncbi:hypothetical protein EYC80_004886 [Monilinia laxa]|uniref:Uncharacterized protein n=1 Tax=Monilinia laxa TaxID=61186 RepID=A0A5N6KIF6_MONLA|nr:hypothetical protein EYC80_004886 [Monilinia laxa]